MCLPTIASAVHYTLRLQHSHLRHCSAAAITSWECFNAGSDSPELAGGVAPRGHHACRLLLVWARITTQPWLLRTTGLGGLVPGWCVGQCVGARLA